MELRWFKKAIFLALGLIVLAESAQDKKPPDTSDVQARDGRSQQDKASAATISKPEVDQQAEAVRAYKHALSTLSTLTAHPPSYTSDSISPTTSSSSFLSNFLPNLQGQGPVGSAIRITIKLYHHSWIHRLMSRIGKESPGTSRKKSEDMRGKAIKVIDLLQHSVELGNTEALYTLAQISLFPPNVYFPLDPALAYTSFKVHADATGNASSQALLAFFHATGYKDVVPIDQAKAFLYYTFAGKGDSKGAQMAAGYRLWSGIGTEENCIGALEWYEKASKNAMAKFLSGPPGGRALVLTPTRLSDLAGGVYGPGASVASTGIHAQRPAIKAGLSRAAGETWEDVLEYYLFNADRGEIDFAYRLGKIFYQGSIYASPGGIASGSEGVGSIPRDYHRARFYFNKIARQVWSRDPVNPLQYQPASPKEESQGPFGYAAASAGYLGRMYLRGEGVKADPAMAKMWFERGTEYNDRECHNGLGIIWRDGLTGKKDMKKALHHFGIAAGQELAEAQVNMGKYHYSRNELKAAVTYYDTAMRHGSPFEAYYYLADIHGTQAKHPAMPQSVAAGSCAMAVSFHKIVAERGVWGEDLLKDADAAWSSGTERGREIAMLKWRVAAEQGFEVAQNNLAFVLDQDKSILRLTRFSPNKPSNASAKLALTHWIRSAAQRNVDALVKVADYYYHGLGIPDDEQPVRFEKAAWYYQSAADTQMSALAMWNLGWMYENGVGVPQDFYLAKRNYDLALETNSEAYVPVVFSLMRLYARSVWHTLTGGKDGLSLWLQEEDTSGHRRAETPEVNAHGHEHEQGEARVAEALEDAAPQVEEEDGQWYLGRAKEEFQRRRRNRNAAPPQGQDEDLLEWARERRNAERERDADFGPEDYFEAALRGGHRREGDDFGETVILVLLCASISILLYVRRRLVDRMRRDQEEGQEEEGVQRQRQRRRQQQHQQPQQRQAQTPPEAQGEPPAQRGVVPDLPAPDDLARADWAVFR